MYKRLAQFVKNLTKCIYFLIIFLLFISLNYSQSFPTDSLLYRHNTNNINLVQSIPHLKSINYFHSFSAHFNNNLERYESGDSIPHNTSRSYSFPTRRHSRSLRRTHRKATTSPILRSYEVAHHTTSNAFQYPKSLDVLEPPSLTHLQNDAIHEIDEENDEEMLEQTIIDTTDQRRRARATKDKNSKSGGYCPGQDVATRAFLAKTVFEGKVRSMSSTKNAVTFEVKEVHKNQPGFKPLVKNETIRLHFSNKQATAERSGCAGNTKTLLLKPGKIYILFVDRVATHSYNVLGPPVPKTFKTVQAVRKAMPYSKAVRPANVSDLRDVTLQPGKKLKLICRTRGFPPPQVTWLKNSKDDFLNIRRVRVIHRRRQSTLAITKVKLEDAGHYECKARGVIGPTVTKSAYVRVSTKSENTEAKECPEKQYCLNGGNCTFVIDLGEMVCVCVDGYQGTRCENKTPDVAMTKSTYTQYSCDDKYLAQCH